MKFDLVETAEVFVDCRCLTKVCARDVEIQVVVCSLTGEETGSEVDVETDEQADTAVDEDADAEVEAQGDAGAGTVAAAEADGEDVAVVAAGAADLDGKVKEKNCGEVLALLGKADTES